MKKLEVKKVLKEEEIQKVLKSEKSKSKKIIELFEGGLEVKTIAELLNIRYNFSYNVISNYINLEDIEVYYEKKNSKKDKILELLKEKKSVKEISKELKLNMNYVYKVVKENKEEEKVVNK